MSWTVFLLVVALILLVLAAFNVAAPRINLGWLGVALIVLASLLGRGILPV